MRYWALWFNGSKWVMNWDQDFDLNRAYLAVSPQTGLYNHYRVVEVGTDLTTIPAPIERA